MHRDRNCAGPRLRVGFGHWRTGVSALLLAGLWAAPAGLAAEAAPVPAQDRAGPGVQAPRVQSLLLRAVTVTYDLERSLLFYRDILRQEVVEDVPLAAERARRWLDCSAQAEVRHLTLRGTGEYPGGPIAGGRISFISVREPDGKVPPLAHPNRKGSHGDTILPHRVRGLDEIYAKLKAAGFEVLFPPQVSSTGLSRNMMVFDPNGHIVELFELK